MYFTMYTLVLLLVCLCSGSPVFGQSKSSGWTNKQTDICIVMDSSSSVWIVSYNKTLSYVASLVSDMDIGPSKTRVGVGVFSDNFRIHIPITNNLSKDQLKLKIKETPYLRGDGYLSSALQGLREQCLGRNVVRSQIPQIAVLITDSSSRHKQLTANNATLIKKDGIFLFVVAVGNEVDQNEMRMIASDPKPTFYYYLTDFNNFPGIQSKLSTSMSEVEVFVGDEGKCGGKTKVDTVFVFDEAALGQKDTQLVKAFIKASIDSFSVNSGNVRLSVVSKTCQEGNIVLGQYVTKEAFSEGLLNSDGPGISDLLKRVRLNSFLPESGARPDSKYRIVLFLPTNISKKTEIAMDARRANYDSYEMFVISLGTDYDKAFVHSLVPNTQNAIFVDSANNLMKSKDEFTQHFCREL